MPDSKYYDENGNPIEASPKVYYDSNGKPLIPYSQIEAEQNKPIAQKIEETKTKVAPYLGRAAAEMAPFVGSFGGPIGTAVGTLVKQSLKKLAPGGFGEAPATGTDAALDYAKELTFNNLIPAGIGKAIQFGSRLANEGRAVIPISLKNFPAVREGAVKTLTEQIMGKNVLPESQIVEQGAEKAAQQVADLKDEIKAANKAFPPKQIIGAGGGVTLQFSPQAQAAMNHLTDVFGKNKVGRMLTQMDREVKAGTDVAGSQTYKEIANTVLSDLTHVRNAQLAAGEDFTKELATNKLFTAGFSESKGQLNATKILDELGGPRGEIYREALGSDIEPMTQTLETLRGLQGKGITDRIVNYAHGRLIWTGVSVAELAGFHASGALLGAAAGGVTLTNKLLTRMMQNPQTAQLVTAALTTPRSAPQAGMISKALGKAIAGLSDVTVGVPEK